MLLYALLTVAAAAAAPAAAPPGANWSGSMHPSIPMPASCNLSYFDTSKNGCAPTYGDLFDADALWPCPGGANTSAACAGAGGCVPGVPIGDSTNPVCQVGLSDATPCCCPKQGCSAEPLFNWVVGVCRGAGCACSNFSAPSCGAGSGKCSAACSGPRVPCCFDNDVTPLVPFYEEGSHARVNYIAAYQFNASTARWDISAESSFNTDGRFPAFDLMRPFGGLDPAQAWLAPQPGGSVFWSAGYYPAGVRGLGPPGALFVLSTEDWFGATWYMLNQLTLDRGPAFAFPAEGCAGGVNDNCWAAGNAGEMDFLEPAWNSPAAALLNYTAAFATSANQVGRCFTGGVNTGGFRSSNYVLTEASPLAGAAAPEPIVYVAVVDAVGNWVYRIPAARVDALWPGLGRTTAAASLPAAPAAPPDSVNPGTTPYAASFTSNCQATNISDARRQNCVFSAVQGFCGNWMAQMADTRQPLFPAQNCTRDVRGGRVMPWCACMVGGACP
jgi:hypothetical protein